MKKTDFSEYTRLRDIAQKRQKRIAASGLAPAIHIPTVKEIKAGLVDMSQAMRELKGYLSQGSTVTAVKQTGLVPEFQQFPSLPDQNRRVRSEEERKAAKREANRRYRQRKRIKEKLSPEKARKYDSYLKALDTIFRNWKRAGMKFKLDPSKMTPSQAMAFVEYIDFRFSQGDFTKKYLIDEFMEDYEHYREKNYTASDIEMDFMSYLATRNDLLRRSQETEGLTPDQIREAWANLTGRKQFDFHIRKDLFDY